MFSIVTMIVYWNNTALLERDLRNVGVYLPSFKCPDTICFLQSLRHTLLSLVYCVCATFSFYYNLCA